MSKEFLSEPPNYRLNESIDTPFYRAKQEWDARIGQTVVQAKNWRLAAICSSLVALILSSTLVLLIQKNEIIPVVVGIDKERGEAKVIGRVSDIHYMPELPEIRFFITHFITLIRGVPSDPVLIKQNWLKAYYFLRREAANMLNQITNSDEQSPLKRIGKTTVVVRPISVVQVAGSDSYQARWEETLYDQHGTIVEKFTMNGVFTVEFAPPSKEETLAVNPLGLYIRSFQWNREL